MNKHIFIWIFLISFTSGCGYTPIYTSNSNRDFNVEIINTKGDYDLNNFIKQKITRTSKNNNLNETFEISISSEYVKKVQTKDKSGNVTQYSLNASVNFAIEINNELEIVNFNEKSSMNKFNDDFEESNYERSFKENISQIFTNKLIMYLSRKK